MYWVCREILKLENFSISWLFEYLSLFGEWSKKTVQFHVFFKDFRSGALCGVGRESSPIQFIFSSVLFYNFIKISSKLRFSDWTQKLMNRDKADLLMYSFEMNFTAQQTVVEQDMFGTMQGPPSNQVFFTFSESSQTYSYWSMLDVSHRLRVLLVLTVCGLC